jgi:hypothetical protein
MPSLASPNPMSGACIVLPGAAVQVQLELSHARSADDFGGFFIESYKTMACMLIA